MNRTVWRRRLSCCGAVLAVALGLLAMHQLSPHHRAATPPSGGTISIAGPIVHGTGSTGHAAAPTLPSGADPGDGPRSLLEQALIMVAAGAVVDGSGSSGHQLIVGGCLVALALLITLCGPRPHRRCWRTPRRPARYLSVAPILQRWRRRRLTLVQLSISRT